VRVFVTGAQGFVGRHLVPRLLEEGFVVSATDLELDVTDRSAVEARLKREQPDAIIHLAAQSSVAVSAVEPEKTQAINYGGTLSILEGALQCESNPRILLIGSADQYGSAPAGAAPFTEEAPLAPKSPYAQSKADAERLGTTFLEKGLDVVRIRAFSHSGPGQADAFALSSFARQVAEIETGLREPVLRVGNLNSVRDYLDVRDVIEAYVRLLDPSVEAEIYNVASGIGTRLGDLLNVLLGFIEPRPRVERDPKRYRPADCSIGDASRLRVATGWEPTIAIDRTLRDLFEDWRRRVSAS
jgi:GDP-4-dehydro-6-deoxy-D-mannose reductase